METRSTLFRRVREIFSQEQVAERMGRSIRTVRRWEGGQTEIPAMAEAGLREMLCGGSALNEDGARYGSRPEFTFIDLFAGIGGTRRGFEAAGGKCVFTSEWDKFSVQTYRANHADNHEIVGDITRIDEADIPPHDVLVAGFPCQPFSLAGVSKKNSLGMAHGFLCAAQGTLFFDIARILRYHRPRAFLLENVKNLRSHDGGRTFNVIMGALRKELGYYVDDRIIDARCLVPQHRERIYMVGFHEDSGFSWNGVDLPDKAEGPRLGSILHGSGDEPEEPYSRQFRNTTVADPKYTLSDHLWNYLQAYAKKHQKAGNGFGCSVFGPQDVARTLSARYHKDGSEILIDQGRNKNPRRLTPRECARLMGFSDDFLIPVSDTQGYRQFGNSVVVPVVERIAKAMATCLRGEELPAIQQLKNQLEMPIVVNEQAPAAATG